MYQNNIRIILLISVLYLPILLVKGDCTFTAPQQYNNTNDYTQVPCNFDYTLKWEDIIPISTTLYGQLKFINSSIPLLLFTNTTLLLNGSSIINFDCNYINEDVYFYIRDNPETYMCRTMLLNISKCGNQVLDPGEECDVSLRKSTGCNKYCICKYGYRSFGMECCQIGNCIIDNSQVINVTIDLSGLGVEIKGDVTFKEPPIIDGKTSIKADCIYGKISYNANYSNLNIDINPLTYKCNIKPTITILNESICINHKIVTRQDQGYERLFIKFDDNMSLGERLSRCNKVISEKDKVLCKCSSAKLQLSMAILIPLIVVIVIIVIVVINKNDKIKDKIFPWRKSKKDDY